MLHSLSDIVQSDVSVATVCRLGSVQNTAKSLDLMRNLLQKFINKEIDVIIQKYVVVSYKITFIYIFINLSYKAP